MSDVNEDMHIGYTEGNRSFPVAHKRSSKLSHDAVPASSIPKQASFNRFSCPRLWLISMLVALTQSAVTRAATNIPDVAPKYATGSSMVIPNSTINPMTKPCLLCLLASSRYLNKTTGHVHEGEKKWMCELDIKDRVSSNFKTNY